MLTKVGNVLINENRIPEYKKYSFYVFIIGIVLFFSLPFLTNKIFITEKQMKNSEVFYNQFTHDFFISELEKIKASFDSYNNLYEDPKNENNLIDKRFMKLLFSKNKSNDIINSVQVNSQRGERLKFLMINIIYDNEKNSESNLLYLFTFINHFSSIHKSNYHWLAKDIQFNFIQKDSFYKNPKYTIDLFTGNKNTKIKEGQAIDFIMNIDSTQLNFKNIVLKINGANSEIVDMDFYKILIDNFSSLVNEKKIKTFNTFNTFFTNKVRRNIFKIFSQISDVIKLFLSFVKPIEMHNNTGNDFVYFIENIMDNYLHANEQMDSNHLLISKGFNSVLIKSSNLSREYLNEDFENNLRDTSKFLQSLERIIKIFSKSEIDLFRGDYNFILFSSVYFVNIGLFLFVPVLLVIRIFYEILEKIYSLDKEKKNNAEENNSITNSNDGTLKGVTVLLVSFLLQIILFFHIEQIKNLIQPISYDNIFYLITGFNFSLTFLIFFFVKLNHSQLFTCDVVICFLFAVNCFNFLFINYGMGLLITLVILPVELIFIRFKNKFFRISLLLQLIFVMLYSGSFLNHMIYNYVEYFNNIYPIFSTIIAMIICRINLYLNGN